MLMSVLKPKLGKIEHSFSKVGIVTMILWLSSIQEGALHNLFSFFFSDFGFSTVYVISRVYLAGSV